MIADTKKLPLSWHGFVDLTGKDLRPMSAQESEIFLKLTLAEMDGSNDKIHNTFMKLFTYQVLQKRLEAVQLADKISAAVKAMVASMSNLPGDAVVWAFTLAYIYAVEKVNVDLEIVAHYFPFGFPTEEAKDRIWDAQKGYNQSPQAECDNMVDNFDNWPKVE